MLTSVADFKNDPREEIELFTWDSRTGSRRLAPTDLHGYTLSMALARDGKFLAATAGDGTVRVWDATALTERVRFGTGRVVVSALAITPDGGWLATPTGKVTWSSGTLAGNRCGFGRVRRGTRVP